MRKKRPRNKMQKPSLDPMKFGSQNDLQIALTELRVIEKSKGRLSQSDFLSVSQKYMFPIDFLKQGLKGFSYPEDWLISTSKWFTILYSWMVKDKERSSNLFRLQFAYVFGGWVATVAIVVSIVALVYVEGTLPYFFHIDLFHNFLEVALPFVFFIVSLGAGFGIFLNDRKAKIEDYSDQLREAGLGYIIENNERFIIQNYRAIAYGAGNIFLRKLAESNTFTFIHVGMNEEDKQPSSRAKLLVRLHLLPKSFATSKKEKIPVFYGENAYVEYKKRIEDLSKENKTNKK
jgi:hypothetical protein